MVSRRLAKILGYAVFLLAIASFFLYLYFPSEAIRQYVEASATRISPDLSVDIEGIRPSFPLGVKLKNTRVHQESKPGPPIFVADTLVLLPTIDTILEWRPVIRFSCDTYGGEIDGRLALDSFDFNGFIASDVDLKGILLERYPMLRERLKRKCTGVISGAVSYAFDTKAVLAGSGQADLSVRDGTVGFIQPFMGLDRLGFESISVRVRIKDEQAVVQTLSVKGDALNAEGRGTIRLNQRLGRSMLDLTVEIDPSSGFLRNDQGTLNLARLFMNGVGSSQLQVRIHGTLAQPRFRLP